MKISVVITFTLCILSVNLKAQTSVTYRFDTTLQSYIISYYERDSLVEKEFEPNTKVDPIVRGKATFLNDTITFLYSIENKSVSEQHLSDFFLPIDTTCFEFKKPNNDWRLNYFSNIGMWHWVNTKLIRYNTNNVYYYEFGIPPNSIVYGFSYRSMDLPGIISCYFQGATGLMSFENEPPGEVREILDSLRSFPRNYVQKFTIGSSKFLKRLLLTVFPDTLLSYTRQSVQLGWLKTTRDDDYDEDEQPQDGISRNIEKRIEKAKKELMKGDSVKARKELEKLVKKVEKIYKKSKEAEKKKREHEITMTNEAYALLKYNTEYLIERLPEKKKGGKE